MDQQITLKAETVYECPIFTVEKRTVRLPDGREARRDVLLHPGAAAVIPVMDDGRLLLVRQYRDGLGGMALEIPAGRLDPGEDPAECAGRELEEETGYRANKLRFATKFYTVAGYSTEVIYMYIAEGLTQAEGLHCDDEEFIEPVVYALEDALRLADEGGIEDGKTLLALMWLARERGRQRA